jgi:hypothetical protein
MFPAAVMEDQEALMGQSMEPFVFSPPPYSSDDPETDAQRLVPISGEEQEEAMSAKAEGAEGADAEDDDKKAADWKAEVEAATSQEELDEIADRYSESDADFKTVDKAIADKEDELQNQ